LKKTNYGILKFGITLFACTCMRYEAVLAAEPGSLAFHTEFPSVDGVACEGAAVSTR